MNPDEVHRLFVAHAAWVHGGYERVCCEGCGDTFDADSVIVDGRGWEMVWCSMGCWLRTWAEPAEIVEQCVLL